MNSHRRTSVAIIYNSATQSVLLQHRDAQAPISPNKWALFGGSAEGDESPTQTILRELHEELGILFPESQVRLLNNYFNPDFQIHNYVFVLESSISKSEIRLGEGDGVEWIPVTELAKYDIPKYARKDLDSFIQYLRANKRLS